MMRIYVAKHLWRDNLFPMKLSLDHIMKFHCLRKMLEWQMGIAESLVNQAWCKRERT